MGRKKLMTVLKLQIPAGQASPAPPVGPALGQHGVNIMEFVQAYNAATQAQAGTIIPVEVSIFEDRSFTFITRRAQQGEGRNRYEGSGPRHRQDEDARSQCKRHRQCHVDRRRHGPIDGS